MESKQQSKVRFEVIKYILNNCEKLNIQRSDLIEKSGLDENLLEIDPLYVPLSYFEKIVIYLDENLKDPLFFLKVLLINNGPSIAVLGLLMTVSNNLDEAIVTACKYREINGNIGDEMVVGEDESQLYLKLISCSDNLTYIRRVVEFRFLWWVDFIKKTCDNGGDFIKCIYFEHRLVNVGEEKLYSEFYGCPVYFNMGVSMLVVSKDALKIPFRSANRELYLSIEKYVSSLLDVYVNDGFILNKIKSLISFQLQNGVVSREIVAERLGLNIRTLTRKLSAEGTTYSNLLEEVRLESAKEYLSDSNMNIVTISKKLGFFTSNAFITWFKILTGKTPKKYRDYQKTNK
ncbi:AraC family transcriptional regulator [Acinetobacter sp. ESBL14]|uniref:AraC family transcriptional regulator n=1 Tax=Acinetobacter sp. ESBL14 TaxID=3077329 RepID=UPI002FC7E7F7